MNKKNINSQVIVGAQWGDEGKGKIVDFLAQSADVVVRYQGGNNAGHTVWINKKKYTLKHLPSGILSEKTKNFMAQGMVINPKELLLEIQNLKNAGINQFQLYISNKAHVIFPYHIDIDAKYESFKKEISSSASIGTTKKGIGPTYEDKMSRIGIRFGDFVCPQVFKTVLKETLFIKNKQLVGYGLKPYSVSRIFDEYSKYAQKLKSFVCDTSLLLFNELKKEKKVIFEAAQGVMLCVDNGTYPYVTSSSPTASAIPLYTGLNPFCVKKVTGVVKAYTSRVGQGVMPTSIEKVDAKIANQIRKIGNEFGTVTQRARSIGWLDIVAVKYAARVSGFTEIALTLLDVLSFLKEIKICVGYKLNGKQIENMVDSYHLLEKCSPIYITLEGWDRDISHIKSFEDLPPQAQGYIRVIESLLKLPVKFISVGPSREQTIQIK